jgi:DNA polymerase-3 subunit delta'
MHIIGHHKERERLQGLVEREHISQGYLFFGPQSVGKSLCAQEFACNLVSDPDFKPSKEKPHPFDVSIIRPEVETKRGVTKEKNISAESMRDALLFLGRFPAAGKFRVVIVEDAHKLSQAAQNVLLKTLEEPNPTAVIILVTHEIGNIVSTILSRVEKVRFDYVPLEEIESGVRSLLPAGREEVIAPFFFSLGRPGMILRAAADPESFRDEREKLERLFRLSTLSLAERMKLAEELSKNVPEAVRLLEWWLPGLHTQALKNTDTLYTTRFFGLLEKGEQTLQLLKTTQSNARLLLEKLFFAI